MYCYYKKHETDLIISSVCQETHLISTHEYKSNKYKNIASCGSSLAGNRKVVSHFIEISTLGFISSCSDFTRAVNIEAMSAALKHSIVKSAVKSSLDIYCKRNYADPIAALNWLHRSLYYSTVFYKY